mmetsp:Transcript_1203/g.3646  ORF Transcript_1203/g.3646 Transcript_1203/m.3646 type:complete len:233 (+) Transcript_1203:2-700(+)
MVQHRHTPPRWTAAPRGAALPPTLGRPQKNFLLAGRAAANFANSTSSAGGGRRSSAAFAATRGQWRDLHSSRLCRRLAAAVLKKHDLLYSTAVSLSPCGPLGPPGGNRSGRPEPGSAATASSKAQPFSAALQTRGKASPLTGQTERRSSMGQSQRPSPASSSRSGCCASVAGLRWGSAAREEEEGASSPTAPSRKSAGPTTRSRLPTHSGMDSIQPRASAPRCRCCNSVRRL